VVRFKQKITSALEASDIGPFRELIEQYEKEHNVPAIEIAAALARLVQGDRPLLLKTNAGGGVPVTEKARQAFSESVAAPRPSSPRHTPAAPSRSAYEPAPRADDSTPPSPRHADDGEAERPRPKRAKSSDEEVPKETFRIEVGSTHGVKPGNIVGAIANEAGIDSEYIGRIDIREDHSFIDLPTGMPKKIFKDLQKVWVSGRQLRITRKDQANPYSEPPPKHGKPKHKPRT